MNPSARRLGVDARFFSTAQTGIGRHVAEVLPALFQLDYQIVLFVQPGSGETFKKQFPQAEIVELSIPHYSWKEQVIFPWILYSQHIDLMWFPNFNVPLLYRKPFIVTVHDLTIHRYPGTKKRGLLSRLAYKVVMYNAVMNSRTCITVSQHAKSDIIDYYKRDPLEITVVYNGVSAPSVTYSLEEQKTKLSSIGISGPYFFYCGVLREHKNISRLLDAYDLFCSRYRHPPKLVLAGPKDDAYQDIYDRCSHEFTDRVVLLGWIDDATLFSLFSQAEAFVFPSLYEGFGIPPLEAMSVNTLVVSSNAASLPEVCADAAILVDPHSVESMADGLEKAYTLSEEEREVFRKKGIERVSQFTWESVQNAYCSLIRLLL